MPPLRVLVVARWYPAVDDPVRGSFIADQIDALVASGQVEPMVTSFEFVRLNRVPERREPEREAIHLRFGTALRERLDAATPGGWPAAIGTWRHLADVPVARLPIASGPEDPPAREGDEHLAAFLPFVEGLLERAASPAMGRSAAAAPPFDLLHAHTGFPDGELAAAAARRFGIPYVVTEHSSLTRELLADPEVRHRYASVVRDAARLIVVSEALAAELRAALPDLTDLLAERLEVVPNAVPIELFRAPPSAERRRGELLFVGARKADKGIATLLEAFALARTRRPDLTLRLIGRSPTPEQEATWRARATELGVAEAVAFDPPTDRAGVAEAMARADLFVHPSRYETFGVVAVEALASGLPVVATRSGGVAAIVGSDPSALGALVPVDDARALADAILETLARRERFDPARLRAAVTERFGAAAVAQRLLAIYHAVADSAAGRAAGKPATPDADAAPTPPRPAADEPTPPRPAAVAPTPPRPAALAPAPAGAPQAPSALPIIVAFNRVQAARLLGTLPPALRAQLTVVTAEDPGNQPLPEGIGRLVAADLDAGYQAALRAARPAQPPKGLLSRAIRFARDPGASDRIAAVHANRPRYRLETARLRVAEEARATTGIPDLLCIDGYDVLVAGPAIDSGVARLAPGGIRWLADRWAAGTVT
jgi:glycosyltransferase involved in cell wall biosynthesis